MIQLLEGVPGSGKSYHAVKEYLLPWVRSGRRLYVAVDGFFLDRLALFTGIPLTDLEKQVTLWNGSDSIPSLLLSVTPGAAVVIDEAQTIFRAKEKVPPEVLRWLETHRHIGVDVLLMAQDYRQMTSGVTRLVESTTRFRRMERFGLQRRYQGFIRGNPEETEVIRTLVGKYDPKVYAYYSSYSAAGVKEVRKVKSVASSPLVLAGIVGLVCAVGWFSWGTWLSPTTAKAAVKLPPPVSSAQLDLLKKTVEAPTAGGQIIPTAKLRIQGGMRVGDKTYWVDDSGRILDSSQVAILSGAPVSEVATSGVPSLTGAGILWGGSSKDDEGTSEPNTVGSSIERLPIEDGATDSKVFVVPSPDPVNVKCIGVDGVERDC